MKRIVFFIVMLIACIILGGVYFFNRMPYNKRTSLLEESIKLGNIHVRNAKVMEIVPFMYYKANISLQNGEVLIVSGVRKNLRLRKSAWLECVNGMTFTCYECSIYRTYPYEVYGGAVPIRYIDCIYGGGLDSIFDLLSHYDWLDTFIRSLPFDDFSSPSAFAVFDSDRTGGFKGHGYAGYFEIEKEKKRIYLLKHE